VDEYVCPNCGTPARGASVCADCGPGLDSYKELPRQSEFEAGGIEVVRSEYAEEVKEGAGAPGGVLIRWGALVLDNFVLIGCVLVVVFVVALAGGTSGDGSTVFGAVIGVFLFFYPPLMVAFANGQTLGKKALNVRVEKRDGGRVGIGRAFGRETLKLIFSFIPLGLIVDALVARANDERRSIHDRLFGTRVVTTR
jgi:uncharacterized RDD family membrane protein YckC